jgi:glycosyltransferase involved in cell wall biosynthesis
MQLAYLVNQYPAVSHSFIRREILAIESLGHTVRRYSIRQPAGDLPDPRDQREAELTDIVLSRRNVASLLLVTLLRMVRRPGRIFRAFGLTRTMAAPCWSGLVRRVAYVVEGVWLARELESARVQHLHAHFGTNPAAVARIVHAVSGIPYSFTVHGPDEFDEPGHIDLRGKIADARFVVAISNYGRSQLCRWAGVGDWKKLVVVGCGLGEDQLGGGVSGAEKDIDLCTVARLAPQKGLPLLIDALALLAERGERPSLVLIGDGPMRSELEAQVRVRGLEAQVRFFGSRDGATVTDTLRRSKVMVLPSFAEGLPVVIMEALACGTPVVTTAIAGIPELVDDACGWVIPAGSAEALADALAAALASPAAAREARGRAGRERVLERHDARANAALLARYFDGGL